MKNSHIQSQILENVRELSEDIANEVLDFILFLKQRRTTKITTKKSIKKNTNYNLLLDFAKGLFDGKDEPNDAGFEHDKYLYSN